METNKKLQNLIGNAIGKDYFKLEFGCKIIYQNKDYVYLCPTIQDWFKSFELYSNKTINIAYSEDFEILGQEPTLNDLLLAIPIVVHLSNCIVTKENGDKFGQIDTGKSMIYYNLEKSIFNQEESVKVALIGLLEGK